MDAVNVPGCSTIGVADATVAFVLTDGPRGVALVVAGAVTDGTAAALDASAVPTSLFSFVASALCMPATGAWSDWAGS